MGTGLEKIMTQSEIDYRQSAIGDGQPICDWLTQANRRVSVSLFAVLLLLLQSTTATAIQPGQWVHATEADFDPGQRENTVVTNLGEVKLATRTEALAKITEQTQDKASIVNDLQQLGEDIYVAAGPEGRLLLRSGDELKEIVTLESEQIFALDVVDGKCLLAISGVPSRLAVLDGEELSNLIELPDVRYIWDLIVEGNRIVLATGTEGKLLSVDLAVEPPAVSELLDAAQDNLLCVARDHKGRLITGSDTDGLIYRVTVDNEGQPSAFVIYDAAEPEIGTLVVGADGPIYAGTADANQARPGRLEQPAKEEAGRPDQAPEAPKQQEQAVEQVTGQEALEEKKQLDPAELGGQAETPPSPPDPEPATDPEPEAELTPEAQGDPDADLPTGEQRDRLRQIIRQRLLDARHEGTLQAPAAAAVEPPRRANAFRSSGGSRGSKKGTPSKQGNAIYRIDTDGVVSELFRESVMVLRLVEHDGKLFAATGDEGQLYRIDPAGGERTVLVDLEAKQIVSMNVLAGQQGASPALLLGTANPAQLIRLEPAVAEKGNYISEVLDAGQVSLWGRLRLTATVPENSSVTVQTRSGNVDDPDRAPWSPWSETAVAGDNGNKAHPLLPRELSVVSPPARFLQYRLWLKSDGAESPAVGRVALAYVVPNLAPKIASIKVTLSVQRSAAKGKGGSSGGAKKAGGGSSVINVEWKASDPNRDELEFLLEYQPAGSGKWLLLKDELKQNRFEWQSKQVPDGWYTLRLRASDHPANTPEMTLSTTRRSDPVLVDKTAPEIEHTVQRPEQAGELSLAVTASDALTPVRSVQYALDGTENWHPMLPDDLIFDSTRETLGITISDLEPGPHVLTLRATDRRGNVRHESVFVEVE